MQRSSTPVPASTRPKRVRKDTAAAAAANEQEDLVGKKIRVLWPDEKQFFSGIVTSFKKDTVGRPYHLHANFSVSAILLWPRPGKQHLSQLCSGLPGLCMDLLPIGVQCKGGVGLSSLTWPILQSSSHALTDAKYPSLMLLVLFRGSIELTTTMAMRKP